MMRSFLALALILFVSLSEAAVLGIRSSERILLNENAALEVCWLGAEKSSTGSLRTKIENYLRAELSNKVGLKLEFHTDCFQRPDPFFPIGMAFYDAEDNPEGLQGELGNVTSFTPEEAGHPMAYSKGKRSHVNFVDLILTSRFFKVAPGLTTQVQGLSEAGKENLLLSIALHEFLHVLGFNHEQNRPDSECKEGAETFYAKTATLLTPYDPHSIMNYCLTHHFDFESGPIALSGLDVEGLKTLLVRH